MDLTQLVAECHENSREHGFWEDVENALFKPDTIAHISQKLMLIVSELSEAQEAMRNGYSEHKQEFAEELADAFIRLADLCGYLGIDLAEAVSSKMAKNAARPYKHGREF